MAVKAFQYNTIECGWKESKYSPRCGLIPANHGTEFARSKRFTSHSAVVAHPFVFTGVKAKDED